MKKLLFLLCCSYAINLHAQHTFSIVAVDSITNEIGSAGATCISSADGAIDISDIVLGVGAIHTQSWWTTVNQNAARVRMENGDAPDAILTWLANNDNPAEGGNINDRQYGVVDLNNGHPRSAAYTGSSNWNERGHRIGPGYAIQGNVLISQDVLNDMEDAYLTTTGPLCDKLMAVLQAAKRPGADSRCLAQGISSGSAFIRVAKPTDTNSDYGNLWLDLNVWLNSGTFTGDPIDELQNQFNTFKNVTADVSNTSISPIKIYPNPASSIVKIETGNLSVNAIEITNIQGKIILRQNIQNPIYNLNVSDIVSGLYIINLYSDSNQISTNKIIIE